MYHIGGNAYVIVKDHKNGWNYEVFRERYSEVLERYDYIVGDWGYNQLRLKGFFKENNNKGAKDSSIALLHDYLNEYCNFGCAYFIIEKLGSRRGQAERENGEDGPQEAAERSIEAEKPKDPDFKPRQHYHRNKDEQRHRGGQDKGAAAAGEASPETGKANGHKENREGEPRHKAQDRGQNGQDSRGRGQEQGRGHRDREHSNKGKSQQNNGQQPEKSKGQQSSRHKGQDQQRNRDRDKLRDKEKANPLA